MVTVGYVEFLIRGLKGIQTFIIIFFSFHKTHSAPAKNPNHPVTISIAICLKSLSMPGNTIISHPFNFPFSTRGYFCGILLYCQNTNINRVHKTGIMAYFVLCTL